MLYCIFISAFLLTSIVEGAEFNEKNGSEENIDQIQKGTLSQESLALLTLVSNTYERNCLVDIISKLLFSYSALLLKFSYFFNENVLHEQIKRLRETIFHANIESFFIDKYLLIDYQKLEHLYNSCFEYLKYDLINQLNIESLNQQYKFIMNMIENHAEIIKPIRESQALLEYLISCDLDSSLKSMVSILINYVSEFIGLVEESIKSYKKKKRNFRKFFESRKDFLSKANINLVISNPRLGNLMEMKVNFKKNKQLLDEYYAFLENPDPALTEERASQLKQLYDDYYENNECTEEEILEMESLLLISMELLGLISANIFYFDNQELSKNIRFIEENISNINKKVTERGTEDNFDGEDSFRIRKKVMEELDYEKVIRLNNLSSKFGNKLPREVIIKNLKGLYLCLLNILKILKKEFQLNKCGKYIQELLVLVINAYEKIGKDCAASLKSSEKNKSLTILPLETIRVIRESTMSKCRQIITEQVEKKREKMKEEKEKLEKLEIEKKLQLEQEKLEHKKRLEKLKEKSKLKQKRLYPEVKYEIKKVQEEECDSVLETHKMTRPTVRNKAERRRRLMEELNRFNEKSIKKELIREAVNRQKLTRKSRKNSSSDEMRSKSHLMKMNNAQTEHQNICDIDKECESDQNSSNESSGDEEACSSEAMKKKYVKKMDVGQCLLPVIKLVEESICESNKSCKQSKGESKNEESEGACSSHATEKRVSKKRLANEKPRDTPLVKSTLELFGESFMFETRKVGQKETMERTTKSSCSHETSNYSPSTSQIENKFDNKFFRVQSNSEARKSRSKTKNNRLLVRRASSEPPSRNKLSSNLKTRSKSIPRTRSRSRRRRQSKSRSKLHIKPEICSDDTTSEIISKLIKLEERMTYSIDDSSEHKSKFIPMFSESKVPEEEQSVDIFSFFNIVNLDFLEITETSTIEEIEAAIEFCSEEITRIHTKILPLLTGYDLLQMKNFQKNLIIIIKILVLSDGATAPDNGKSLSQGADINGFGSQVKEQDAFDPSELLAQITSSGLLSCRYETNYFMENIIKFLVKYLSLIVNFSAIFDDRDYKSIYKKVSNLASYLESRSSYSNRNKILFNSHANELLRYVNLAVNNKLFSLLFTQSNHISKEVIDSMGRNWKNVVHTISKMVILLEKLSSLEVDSNLRCTAKFLIGVSNDCLRMFSKCIRKYSKMTTSQFNSLFASKIEQISKSTLSVELNDDFGYLIDMGSNFEKIVKSIEDYNKFLETGDPTLSNGEIEKAKSIIVNFFENGNLDETGIFKKEETALISFEFLGLAAMNLSLLDEAKFLSFKNEVEEACKSATLMINSRGTEIRLSQTVVVTIREEIRTLMRYQEFLRLDFTVMNLNNSLLKSQVLYFMNCVYESLLRAFEIVRKEQSGESGGKYISTIYCQLNPLFEKALDHYKNTILNFEQTHSKSKKTSRSTSYREGKKIIRRILSKDSLKPNIYLPKIKSDSAKKTRKIKTRKKNLDKLKQNVDKQGIEGANNGQPKNKSDRQLKAQILSETSQLLRVARMMKNQQDYLNKNNHVDISIVVGTILEISGDILSSDGLISHEEQREIISGANDFSNLVSNLRSIGDLTNTEFLLFADHSNEASDPGNKPIRKKTKILEQYSDQSSIIVPEEQKPNLEDVVSLDSKKSIAINKKKRKADDTVRPLSQIGPTADLFGKDATFATKKESKLTTRPDKDSKLKKKTRKDSKTCHKHTRARTNYSNKNLNNSFSLSNNKKTSKETSKIIYNKSHRNNSRRPTTRIKSKNQSCFIINKKLIDERTLVMVPPTLFGQEIVQNMISTYNIKILNFSHVSVGSSYSFIKQAIRFCCDEIGHLYFEVFPFLSGIENMILKQIIMQMIILFKNLVSVLITKDKKRSGLSRKITK
ncbi:hypothetical protein CmeUKMEL1_18050 [Cryptosporidium meleagridis]|uniref:Integral membrane protein n=1 Tax=Cryptosporidium meleagridis TaxID=93969 RepID=A0A2P4Z658_9CRYT|nr:hypothetical protein CmeUKMEL1_18050 [Cryptosporidium meleagridis]